MIKEELPPGEVPAEEVQESNMLVCNAFSEMFKPIIGPFGSKKLITREATTGGLAELVSNNAYTIIKELKYNHPAADLLINTGLTQGREVGDGIATVMILIGELVKRGFELKKEGVHQNIVVRGYEKSLEKVKEVLKEIASASAEDMDDRRVSDEILKNVAKTALKKSDYWEEDKLAEIIVESIKRIGISDSDSDELPQPIDVDDVAIVAKSGRGVYETRFFDGVVVDREVLDELPTEIEAAKIALLDFPIEHKEPRVKGRKELKEEEPRKRSKAGQTFGALDFHISLSKPSLMKEFMDKRGEIFDEIIDPIIESGANVVCCRWGVDDDALGKFQKAGIMLLKRVKLMDLKRLERSTGAEIASDVEDLGVGVEKLGFAGRVVQREIGDVKYVSFEECPHKKSSAIIIRGASDRVLEGVVGEIKSALHCVALLMEDRRVVPGGGAVEMECASELRKFAKTIPSKEQIAINSFADALESIPMAIAKNSGMNPLDALVELRAEHSAGNRNAGISGRDKKVKDLIETGIIEPLRVKLQAFISATDAAIEMLKIDDLHIAKSKEREEEEKKHPIERKPPELMGIERKPTPFRYYKGGRVKY